jgi:hypothetical protein
MPAFRQLPEMRENDIRRRLLRLCPEASELRPPEKWRSEAAQLRG